MNCVLLSAFVGQFKKLIFQFLNNLVNCHINVIIPLLMATTMTVVVMIITCNSCTAKSWYEITRGLSNEVDDDGDDEEEKEGRRKRKSGGGGIQEMRRRGRIKETVDTAT